MNTSQQKEQGSKAKGVILLEAVFALILLGMVTYGFAQTSAMAFSQASALKAGDKAKQYADLEAEVLKAVGFEQLEASGIHTRRSMQTITGQNDGFESVVTLAQTVAVSPENTVKVAAIDVYKTGENTPRYTLEVPIASLGGGGSGSAPDYSKAYAIPSGFKAPDDGYLYVSMTGYHVSSDVIKLGISVYINGATVIFDRFDQHGEQTICHLIPISKGDVVSWSGSGYCNTSFCPSK